MKNPLEDMNLRRLLTTGKVRVNLKNSTSPQIIGLTFQLSACNPFTLSSSFFIVIGSRELLVPWVPHGAEGCGRTGTRHVQDLAFGQIVM